MRIPARHSSTRVRVVSAFRSVSWCTRSRSWVRIGVASGRRSAASAIAPAASTHFREGRRPDATVRISAVSATAARPSQAPRERLAAARNTDAAASTAHPSAAARDRAFAASQTTSGRHMTRYADRVFACPTVLPARIKPLKEL